MSFRLVPKSVTLNDLELHCVISLNLAVMGSNQLLLKSSWRPFCLPVDSYRFTYWTGTVYLL